MKKLFCILSLALIAVLLVSAVALAQDDDECGPTICDGERRHVGCSSAPLIVCGGLTASYLNVRQKRGRR